MGMYDSWCAVTGLSLAPLEIAWVPLDAALDPVFEVDRARLEALVAPLSGPIAADGSTVWFGAPNGEDVPWARADERFRWFLAFARVVAQGWSPAPPPPPAALRREVTAEEQSAIAAMLRAGNEVGAVLRWKQCAGCGIAEARDAVRALSARGGP